MASVDLEKTHRSGKKRPSDWPGLYALAVDQLGLFTTAQAEAHGISPSHLTKSLTWPHERVERGIYRFTHIEGGPGEDEVRAWLWSRQEGVLSHDTALHAWKLTDALPAEVHLTVPLAQRQRTPPAGVRVYYADLPEVARSWIPFGRASLPVATAAQTLIDLVRAGGARDDIQRGVREAIVRRLARPDELLLPVMHLALGVELPDAGWWEVEVLRLPSPDLAAARAEGERLAARRGARRWTASWLAGEARIELWSRKKAT